MKTAYMMVGVPASGKSTWIAENAIKLSPVNWCEIASSDAIIENIASQYDLTYSEAFQDLIGFADRAYWNQIRRAIEEGDDIILDRTHLDRKSRSKAISMLRSQGYNVIAVVFPIPEPEEWNRRLNSRPGKTIPQPVLDNMVARYQHPILEEGFSSIEYV